MPVPSIKYSLSIVLSILLIFTLFITAWLVPSLGIRLGLIFLLFGLVATGYTIIRKYRKSYQQGNLPLSTCIRNSGLEIAVVLLAMIMASVVGRYLSTLASGGMNSTPQRLLTGIGIGLLAGWAVGLFAKQATGRLIRNSSGR
jgi:hypothetical protein